MSSADDDLCIYLCSENKISYCQQPNWLDCWTDPKSLKSGVVWSEPVVEIHASASPFDLCVMGL